MRGFFSFAGAISSERKVNDELQVFSSKPRPSSPLAFSVTFQWVNFSMIDPSLSRKNTIRKDVESFSV